MDLIDRQALLKQIEIDSDDEPGYYGDTWKFIDTIENLPSATDNNVGTKLSTNLAEVGTDLISRAEAIDALRDWEMCYDWDEHCREEPKEPWVVSPSDVVNKLPPIQPEPKRGKWIRTGSGSLYDHYECSECGKAPKWECMGDNRWKIAFTDFCPNCGADMRGEQDG